jgi:hypothetical protein
MIRSHTYHTALSVLILRILCNIVGGTTDIVVHEKLADGMLKEIHKATGGSLGGTAVDDGFFILIKGIIGGPAFTEFRMKHPLDYLRFCQEWERVKKSVKSTDAEDVCIVIPVSMNTVCKSVLKQSLRSVVSEDNCKYRDDVEYRDGDRLCIRASTVKRLYKDVTDDIIHNMNTILRHDAVNNLSRIDLVGGFSEPHLVQDAIKKAFEGKAGAVLVPPQGSLAVLKGAVISGQAPGTIKARVLRYTYGTADAPIFQDGTHKKSKRVNLDGCWRCTDVFDKIITANTPVAVGHEVTEMAETCERYQDHMDLQLYATEHQSPMYIDDPGCFELGILRWDIPQPSREIRDFKIVYKFGLSELHVKVTDCKTGTICKMELDFLSH